MIPASRGDSYCKAGSLSFSTDDVGVGSFSVGVVLDTVGC